MVYLNLVLDFLSRREHPLQVQQRCTQREIRWFNWTNHYWYSLRLSKAYFSSQSNHFSLIIFRMLIYNYEFYLKLSVPVKLCQFNLHIFRMSWLLILVKIFVFLYIWRWIWFALNHSNFKFLVLITRNLHIKQKLLNSCKMHRYTWIKKLEFILSLLYIVKHNCD